MSYAQPPMGDYKTYGYAGDPGFLSSLWKGIKKVAPTIIGGIIGGPIGVAIGGGVGADKGVGTPPIMGMKPGLPGPPGAPGTSIEVVGQMPGGAKIGAKIKWPKGMKRHAKIGMHQPAGYHLDKATNSYWVRNRRMNVCNPRALRKAMRRVQGFEKLAKRTIQFTRRVKMKKSA